MEYVVVVERYVQISIWALLVHFGLNAEAVWTFMTNKMTFE